MAYRPISGSVPQFLKNATSSADGYYLKFYAEGTTTPLSMATDDTGGTTLAKCALNSRGEPISNDADETTVFIPHLNADYKMVIYPTSTDADNNTTANALFVVDSIQYTDPQTVTNTSAIGVLEADLPDVAAFGVKATDTGIADAYIANTSRNAVSLTSGLTFSMFPLNTNTGACTVDISDILGESSGTTVKNIKKVTGASKTDPAAGDIVTVTPMELYYDGTDFLLLNAAASAASGTVAQIQRTNNSAVTTGTTTMPFDDTIPQNTEGFEVMTVSITPQNASSTLRITAQVHLSTNNTGFLGLALFQDSGANAISAASQYEVTTGVSREIVLNHNLTAGGTSSITFAVRAGNSGAGTVTFNGTGGARRYGGVINSFIQVEEILP